MKALKLKFQLTPIVSLETIKVLNPEDEPIDGIHDAMIPHYHQDDYTYEQTQEEA